MLGILELLNETDLMDLRTVLTGVLESETITITPSCGCGDEDVEVDRLSASRHTLAATAERVHEIVENAFGRARRQ